MYVTALQRTQGKASNEVAQHQVSSIRSTCSIDYMHASKMSTCGGKSVGGHTFGTATVTTTTSLAESCSDLDASSVYEDTTFAAAEQTYEFVDENCYMWGPALTSMTPTSDDTTPPRSPSSSCGCPQPPAVTTSSRLFRRSSMSGSRRKSLGGQVMVPDRIDEDSDCVGFTVTYDNVNDICDDLNDDEDDMYVGDPWTSLASRTTRRRWVFSSASGSPGGDDEVHSIPNVISRASLRIRELPREVEFDSDDDSSSSENESDLYKGSRSTRKKNPRRRVCLCNKLSRLLSPFARFDLP
jgi:hypothetical protein